MNTFQEKVKELARDYENTQSNSPIAKAYYDGAMAAFGYFKPYTALFFVFLTTIPHRA